MLCGKVGYRSIFHGIGFVRGELPAKSTSSLCFHRLCIVPAVYIHAAFGDRRRTTIIILVRSLLSSVQFFEKASGIKIR